MDKGGHLRRVDHGRNLTEALNWSQQNSPHPLQREWRESKLRQVSKAGRLVCSSFSVCIFDPPSKMGRRLPLIWLAYLEHGFFEMGIRLSYMCVQHPVRSITHSRSLEPPPSNEQSATLLWGSFHSVGPANTRDFGQAQTLGFVPPRLGTDVERKTELSIPYVLVNMTENIDYSSHLPGTFITLWYRRGDDWEAATCQLTSGACPRTTTDLRYAWGLKFHYRF